MKIIVFKPRSAVFAFFMLGLITGAVITTLLLGDRVDELYYANRELELRLETVNAELAEMKASISKSKGMIITRISPKIKLPPERFSSQEVEKLELDISKEIIKYYKPLVGSPVKSVDAALLPQIVEGRILEIEEKNYKLSVKTIVLSDTLFIEVEVKMLLS